MWVVHPVPPVHPVHPVLHPCAHSIVPTLLCSLHVTAVTPCDCCDYHCHRHHRFNRDVFQKDDVVGPFVAPIAPTEASGGDVFPIYLDVGHFGRLFNVQRVRIRPVGRFHQSSPTHLGSAGIQSSSFFHLHLSHVDPGRWFGFELPDRRYRHFVRQRLEPSR